MSLLALAPVYLEGTQKFVEQDQVLIHDGSSEYFAYVAGEENRPFWKIYSTFMTVDHVKYPPDR